jgi:hypothetical protein
LVGVVVALAPLTACSSSAPSGGLLVSTNTDGGADGGPGTGGDDAGSPASPAAACDAFATATCTRSTACGAPLVEWKYGDVAGCVAATKRTCANLFAPGSALTPSALQRCTSDTAAAPCSAWQAPESCAFHGTLANGSACVADAQCAAGRCAPWDFLDDTCGRCATPIALGKTTCLSTEDCARGLVCDGSNTCVTPLGVGARCGNFSPDTLDCDPSLVCDANACATPKKLGEPCASTIEDTCDRSAGLFCQNGTCHLLTFAKAGAACSSNFDCAYGLLCDPHHAGCIPMPREGEACDVMESGHACVAPAACNRKDVCTVPDPNACH